MTRWRPLVVALAAGGASLLVAFVPVAWHMIAPGPPAAPPQGAPWQIGQSAAGRIQVFGLDLPGTTLAQVLARWGEDLAVALIDDRAGGLSLEAYLARFEAGGVGGRLVLTFDADAAALARWRERLPGTPTGSGAVRHRLDAAALAEAGGVALGGVGFLPTAGLDETVVSARFGQPARIEADGAHRRHWLYPARGLSVMIDDEGRELLQYVAPADFERRLGAPLEAR